MSKTLPALVVEANEILQEIVTNGGEMNPIIEAILDGVTQEIATKADSYAFVMDKLEAEATLFKERADQFSKAAKACSNLKDRLQERIKMAMQDMGKREVQGDDFRFVLSKAHPKLIVNEEKLPSDYFMVVSEKIADKQKIRQILDAGGEIFGAKYEEVSALRKYVNTKRGTR
jgi:Ni,Fe-hydrogenase I large subunit